MIRNLIGAEWRAAADGAASLPVFNPATGEVIENVPLSGGRDVDAAVAAAKKAFAAWSRTALQNQRPHHAPWTATATTTRCLAPVTCPQRSAANGRRATDSTAC